MLLLGPATCKTAHSVPLSRLKGDSLAGAAGDRHKSGLQVDKGYQATSLTAPSFPHLQSPAICNFYSQEEGIPNGWRPHCCQVEERKKGSRSEGMDHLSTIDSDWTNPHLQRRRQVWGCEVVQSTSGRACPESKLGPVSCALLCPADGPHFRPACLWPIVPSPGSS